MRELQTRGQAEAVFDPAVFADVPPSTRVGYSGYMLFWAPGAWFLEARQNGDVVGTLTVEIS